MDSEGLLKFITAKRKGGLTLRIEIGSAVGEAVDSLRLVLDVVEEYIDKKDVIKVGLLDRRWECGAVISTLFPNEEKTMLAARKIAKRALSVVEKWKAKIESEEGSGGVGHVKAATFLQVVVGFRIISKFDSEFLRKLVMENPSRRDMPKLASVLWEKMGAIRKLLVDCEYRLFLKDGQNNHSENSWVGPVVLLQIEGPKSPEQMLAILQKVVEKSAPVLVTARLDAEERRNNSRLREEQNATYRAVLEADQVCYSRILNNYLKPSAYMS